MPTEQTEHPKSPEQLEKTEPNEHDGSPVSENTKQSHIDPVEKHSDRLGLMPVRPLLFRMALPLMISMIIQALYNVVDSIFVAQVSQDALNAVSLSYPIQNLIIAVAVGTGVGVSTRMSHQLGRGDEKGARETAQHGMLAAIICGLFFAVLGTQLARPFIALFTDKPQNIAMGGDYLFICSLFSIGVFFQIIMERLLLATGRTVFTMWTQLTGALINIILDPLLIFGIGPFPVLGVKGAAIATVTGQICGALLGFILNRRVNREVEVSFRGFRLHWAVIGDIYRIGSASIVIMSITSIMVGFMNSILAPFSDLAVNVLGIYFKVESFIFLPVFGFTNAMVPVLSYNYGAQKRSRMLLAIRHSMVVCVAIMVVGTAFVWVFPEFILSLFNANAEMMTIGVPALRIITLSFPFAGVAIVWSNVFQALHKAMYSMIATITRQIGFILPSAWLLAKYAGPSYTWYSFLIAECAALMLTGSMYRSLRKNRIMKVPDRV